MTNFEFSIGRLTIYSKAVPGTSDKLYFWAFTSSIQLHGPFQFIHQAVDDHNNIMEAFKHDEDKNTVVFVDFEAKRRLVGNS